MSELRFHFIDDAGGEDARLAASILGDCLSRQGYRATVIGGEVTVDATARRQSDPEDAYIVLDEILLTQSDLLGCLGGKTMVVVGTARPARILRHELGRFVASVTTVDASGIAMDEGADRVVALLGGAARAVSLIDPDALSASVWANFDRELPYAAHAAMRAFDQGYSQAQSAI